MRNPTFATAIAAVLEKSINLALQYDPATRYRLASLAGKVLQIECIQPDFQLFIQLRHDDNAQIDIRGHCESKVNVGLHGSLVNILSLLLGPTHNLTNSGVTVSGDTKLLSEIQNILKGIDIDWEEPIIKLIGVLPGHQIAELIRISSSWIVNTAHKTEINISEFISEEMRSVPASAELAKFFQEVDELRSDCERLEARVTALSSAKPDN